MAEFPDMKGLETRNLRRMKQWYLAYSQEDLIRTQLVPELAVDTKRKQLVSQFEDVFFSVPWGHHILIMQRCKVSQINYLPQSINFICLSERNYKRS